MADQPEDDTTPGSEGFAAGDSGSSEDAAAAADAQQAGPPPLAVLNQYIKDMSFEAPTTPAVFARLREEQPSINVNVNVQAKPLAAQQYEVVLSLRAECKFGDDVAFLTELDYGGVFQIQVPENLLRPVLLIECPRLLFPFARHILANTTRDAGFMPLMLGPVDFVALFQRQAQQTGQPGLEELGLAAGPSGTPQATA